MKAMREIAVMVVVSSVVWSFIILMLGGKLEPWHFAVFSLLGVGYWVVAKLRERVIDASLGKSSENK